MDFVEAQTVSSEAAGAKDTCAIPEYFVVQTLTCPGNPDFHHDLITNEYFL